MFTKLVQPQARNSLSLISTISENDLPDSEDFEEVASQDRVVPEDILAAFTRAFPGTSIPKSANFVNRITRQGIVYSTQATHEGNSGVVGKDSLTPFSIQKIVEFSRAANGSRLQGPWLVVRRHMTAGVEANPYLDYPLLKAKMWSPDLDSDLEVLPMSDVVGHYAKHVISWKERKVAVIVSLSRE